MAIGLAYLSDMFHHKTPSKGLSKSLLDIQTEDSPYWIGGKSVRKQNNEKKGAKKDSSSNSRPEIENKNKNDLKIEEKNYLELNSSLELDDKSKSFEIHNNENRKITLKPNKHAKQPLKSGRTEIKNNATSENNSSDKLDLSETSGNEPPKQIENNLKFEDNKETYYDEMLNEKKKNVFENQKNSASQNKKFIYEKIFGKNDPEIVLTRNESNQNEDLDILSNVNEVNEIINEEEKNQKFNLSEKDKKDPFFFDKKDELNQYYEIGEQYQINKENIEGKTEAAFQRKSEDQDLILGKLVQSRITNVSDDLKKEELSKTRKEALKLEDHYHKKLDSEEIIHFTSIHSNEIDFNEYEDSHKIISRQFSKEEEKNLDSLPKKIYDSDILFSSDFTQKDEKLNEYFVSENLYHSAEIITNRKEKMKRALNVSDLDPVFCSPILNSGENNLTSLSNNNNLSKLLTNFDNHQGKEINELKIKNNQSNTLEIDEDHIKIERIPFQKEEIKKSQYQQKFETETKNQSEQAYISNLDATKKGSDYLEEIKIGDLKDYSPQYETILYQSNTAERKTSKNIKDSSQNETLKIEVSQTRPKKEIIKLISVNTSPDITSNSKVSSDEKNSIFSSDKQLSSTECMDTRKFSAEFAFNNENMDLIAKEIEKLKQMISLTDNENDDLKFRMLETEKEKYMLEKEVFNLQQMLTEKNKTLSQKEAILSKLINNYELTDSILKSKYQEKEWLFNQKSEKNERKSSVFSYKRQLMSELAEKTNFSRALLSKKNEALEETNKIIEIQSSKYKELQKLYKYKIEQLEMVAQETDKLLELPEKIRIEEERDQMKRELISKEEKILELEKTKLEMEVTVCNSKMVAAKIIDTVFECKDDKLMEEFEGFVFEN